MKSKIIITVFIAFLMMTSVIGMIWSYNSVQDNNSEAFQYGDYEFQKTDGRYVLELNGNQYVFDNTPYELSEIDIENFNLESDKYYIIFNPDEKDLNLEYSIQKLYLVLKSLNVNIQLACSVEEGCDNSLPIKTCNEYAFYFRRSDSTRIYKDNKCIVVEGDNQGLSKGVDKINLMLLKII